MKLVVGLGNVGKPYEQTRHNLGFMVIDLILQELHCQLDQHNFLGDYVIFKNENNGEEIIFLKPTTMMNLSGSCVKKIIDFYQISSTNMIVIHDDLDLPVGQYKIKSSGSSGGHNGLKDIIAKLQTENFTRFKIGIDHPQNNDVINHVLSTFTVQEKKLLQNPFKKCVKFIRLFMSLSLSQAISKINQE